MRVLAHHGKRFAKSQTCSTTDVDQATPRAKKPALNRSGSITNGNNSTPDVRTVSDAIRDKPWDTKVAGSGDLAVASPLPAAESTKRSSVRKQLEGLFKQRDAELVLDLKNIRKKLNFIEQQAADNDDRPRKRVKRDVVRCQCHVAIWDNRDGFTSPEPIVKRTQLCSITTRDGPFGSKVVDIEMDEPIRIKAAELFVPVTTKGALKLAIGDKYFLETKIIPRESVEVWPPISILSKSEGSEIKNLGKKSIETVQGALVSSYANLPQAPASNVPLSVLFVQDGRTFKSKFGLEVSSMWMLPTTYETKVKLEREESLDRSLFASIVAEKTPQDKRKAGATNGIRAKHEVAPRKVAPKKVELCYHWDTTGATSSRMMSKVFRTASVDGFSCAACRTMECRSLSDLLFHLTTYHHKYKYSVEQEYKDSATGKLVRVVIKVEFADIERKKPLKNTTINPDKEFAWCAPKRPFDVDAYIEGDRTWIGAESQKSNKGLKAAFSGTIGLMNGAVQRPTGFLPAEEVQAIPTPDRRRFHVVPPLTANKVKTSFFRSISHRAMRLDESPLSESDDDMDDSWIRDKHHERIFEQEDLDVVEKEFWTKWDLHIMAEHFPHGRYISDSLVRFVRENRVWLRQEAIWKELQKLIGELKEHGVVDSRVLAGCFKILWRDDDTNADGAAADDSMGSTIHVNGSVDQHMHGNSSPAQLHDTEENDPQVNGSIAKGKAIDRGPGHHINAAAKTSSHNFGSFDHNINSDHVPGPSRDHLVGTALQLVAPGTCGICSRSVTRMRQALACSGQVTPINIFIPLMYQLMNWQHCRTPGTIYHLTCADQVKRMDDWICKACFTMDVESKNLQDLQGGPTDSDPSLRESNLGKTNEQPRISAETLNRSAKHMTPIGGWGRR